MFKDFRKYVISIDSTTAAQQRELTTQRFKSFMEKNIDDNIIDSLDVSRATKVLSQQVRFEDALKITIDYTSLYRKKSQELLDLEQSYKKSLSTIVPTSEQSHEQPKKNVLSGIGYPSYNSKFYKDTYGKN